MVKEERRLNPDDLLLRKVLGNGQQTAVAVRGMVNMTMADGTQQQIPVELAMLYKLMDIEKALLSLTAALTPSEEAH